MKTKTISYPLTKKAVKSMVKDAQPQANKQLFVVKHPEYGCLIPSIALEPLIKPGEDIQIVMNEIEGILWRVCPDCVYTCLDATFGYRMMQFTNIKFYFRIEALYSLLVLSPEDVVWKAAIISIVERIKSVAGDQVSFII